MTRAIAIAPITIHTLIGPFRRGPSPFAPWMTECTHAARVRDPRGPARSITLRYASDPRGPSPRRHREHERRTVDGRRRSEEPRRARVPSGGPRGRHVDRAPPRTRARVPGGQDLGADDRARARAHVPRPVGGRPGRDPRQPRLPRRDEQRDRSLQGRAAVPPHRRPRPAEVPRVRAGAQERPHDAPDGRGQGGRRLRPQGQERRRGHALLPVVHDRAPASHRPEHGRPGR